MCSDAAAGSTAAMSWYAHSFGSSRRKHCSVASTSWSARGSSPRARSLMKAWASVPISTIYGQKGRASAGLPRPYNRPVAWWRHGAWKVVTEGLLPHRHPGRQLPQRLDPRARGRPAARRDGEALVCSPTRAPRRQSPESNCASGPRPSHSQTAPPTESICCGAAPPAHMLLTGHRNGPLPMDRQHGIRSRHEHGAPDRDRRFRTARSGPSTGTATRRAGIVALSARIGWYGRRDTTAGP